jgi:hypothetical protein
MSNTRSYIKQTLYCPTTSLVQLCHLSQRHTETGLTCCRAVHPLIPSIQKLKVYAPCLPKCQQQKPAADWWECPVYPPPAQTSCSVDHWHSTSKVKFCHDTTKDDMCQCKHWALISLVHGAQLRQISLFRHSPTNFYSAGGGGGWSGDYVHLFLVFILSFEIPMY